MALYFISNFEEKDPRYNVSRVAIPHKYFVFPPRGSTKEPPPKQADEEDDVANHI